MFLPEDVWNQVKAFLLRKPNRVLFEKITHFQEDNEYHGLELKYHLYYRLLHVDRNDIIKKMFEFGQAAWRYYIWEMFMDENDLTCSCVKGIRHFNLFLSRCETAPISELLVMLYQSGLLKVSYQFHLENYIWKEMNKLVEKTTYKIRYVEDIM